MPEATQTGEPRVLGRLLLVGLSVWLHAADTLVTATLAPAIIGDLGGVVYINWLITIYEVGAVIAGAATAVASERLGIRAVYLWSSLGYGIGCLVAALSPDVTLVLVGRLLQGLGGGAMLSLSYIVIYRWFEERWRSRMFGLVAGVWGVGSLLGPLIGGLFAEPQAWRIVFWLFLGLSVLLAGLVVVLSPPEVRAEPASHPWPLVTISVLTLATLLIAQSGVMARPLGALGCCASGVLLLFLAAWLDAHAEVRLVPKQLLQPSTPMGAGLAMIFFMAVGTCAFWTYGPLILKALFNLAPIVSGYLLALEAIAWTLGTMYISARPIANQAVLVRLGVLVVAAGAAGFTFTVPQGSLAGIAACAIAQGLGFGVAWPTIVTRLVRIGRAEEALASAAPATLQRIGYAVGTALAGVFARFAGLTDQLDIASTRSAGVWVFAGFVPLLLLGLWLGWRFAAVRVD